MRGGGKLCFFATLALLLLASWGPAGVDGVCEDKPVTGKYSCDEMANKLKLCEKSEHVKTLCPKSCRICTDGAPAEPAPRADDSRPVGAADEELTKQREAHQAEIAKMENAMRDTVKELDTLRGEHSIHVKATIASEFALKQEMEAADKAWEEKHKGALAKVKEEGSALKDTVVQALKEEHEGALNGIKGEHSEQLKKLEADLKEKHDQALKEHGEASVQGLKDEHSEQLKKLEVELSAMQALKDGHSEELKKLEAELKESHDKVLSQIKQEHEAKLVEAKAAAAAAAAVAEQVDGADAKAREAELAKEHSEEVAKITEEKNEFATGVEALKMEMAQLVTGHEEELKTLAEKHSKALEEQAKKYRELEEQVGGSAEGSDAPPATNADARLHDALGKIEEMEKEVAVCKIQKTKLTMLEMSIPEKEGLLDKEKKKAVKLQDKLREVGSEHKAKMKIVELDIESKDDQISKSKVALERAERELAELRDANSQLKHRVEDAEASVNALTVERDECVGKAASSPQGDNDEALSTCQGELANKQAEFDAELINLKESHATALEEAAASRVQVADNGEAATAGSAELASCQAELSSAKDAFSTNKHSFDQLKEKQEECEIALLTAQQQVEDQAMTLDEVADSLGTTGDSADTVNLIRAEKEACLSELDVTKIALAKCTQNPVVEAAEEPAGDSACKAELEEAWNKIKDQEALLTAAKTDKGEDTPMESSEALGACEFELATAKEAHNICGVDLTECMEKASADKEFSKNQTDDESLKEAIKNCDQHEFIGKLSVCQSDLAESKGLFEQCNAKPVASPDRVVIEMPAPTVSYGTIALIFVAMYAIVPLGKAFPNGCSTTSIIFFWASLSIGLLAVIFAPSYTDSISTLPSRLSANVCGEQEWVLCIEQTAENSPAVAVLCLLLVGALSFLFCSQLPSLTSFFAVATFLSWAVNGGCMSIDSTSPSAPLCGNLQGFLQEQTVLALSDVCVNGTLDGCRVAASSSVAASIGIIVVAALFAVGLVAIYVELVGDMSDDEGEMQQPPAASRPARAPEAKENSNAALAATMDPGQQRVPAAADAGQRPSTMQIVAKFRQEKESAIKALKEQQEQEIAALHNQYKGQQPNNSEALAALEKQHAAVRNKLQGDLDECRQRYESQIRDLEQQLRMAETKLSAQPQDSGDTSGSEQLQQQLAAAEGKLNQAMQDLGAWDAAYKELKQAFESQSGDHSRVVETLQSEITELRQATAANMASASGSSPGPSPRANGSDSDGAEVMRLKQSLAMAQSDLEVAHTTHRSLIGEMQGDYEVQQMQLKNKLGEVVRRFKMLKMQNDGQKQKIQELMMELQKRSG